MVPREAYTSLKDATQFADDDNLVFAAPTILLICHDLNLYIANFDEIAKFLPALQAISGSDSSCTNSSE